MINDFCNVKDIENVPFDWTLYYLRKKALTEKINNAELAWVILNFNQKRGYYQLRGDELDKKDSSKVEKYYASEIKRSPTSSEEIFFCSSKPGT